MKKLLIILFFGWSGLFGQSVLNTATFTIGQVMIAVYGDSTAGRNTATLFYDSDGAKFDATYGSKTMNPQTINGFRNYGYMVLPTVTTNADVTQITSSGGMSGGYVVADGGATVTSRGIAWRTSANPTLSDSVHSSGSGTGTFASNITTASAATTYHIRAYATNSVGTAYGSDVSFVTAQAAPTVATCATAGTITGNSISVTCNTVTSDGGATVTARGWCWSPSTTNPDISFAHTSDGTGTGSYTSTATGLTSSRLYYFRAYATNSIGTSYGASTTFTTSACTRPTGLTDMKFYYTVDGNAIMNASQALNFTANFACGYCTYYEGETAGVEGDTAYWVWGATTCDDYVFDHYYVMTTMDGSSKWAVYVSAGVLHYIPE